MSSLSSSHWVSSCDCGIFCNSFNMRTKIHCRISHSTSCCSKVDIIGASHKKKAFSGGGIYPRPISVMITMILQATHIPKVKLVIHTTVLLQVKHTAYHHCSIHVIFIASYNLLQKVKEQKHLCKLHDKRKRRFAFTQDLMFFNVFHFPVSHQFHTVFKFT